MNFLLGVGLFLVMVTVIFFTLKALSKSVDKEMQYIKDKKSGKIDVVKQAEVNLT